MDIKTRHSQWLCTTSVLNWDLTCRFLRKPLIMYIIIGFVTTPQRSSEHWCIENEHVLKYRFPIRQRQKKRMFCIVLAVYFQKRQNRIFLRSKSLLQNVYDAGKKTMHQENTSLFDGTKLEHKVMDEDRRRSICGYDILSLPVIHTITSSGRLWEIELYWGMIIRKENMVVITSLLSRGRVLNSR